MSINIMPNSEVTTRETVIVKETTLQPGDKLVITTDSHLDELEHKISQLELSNADLKVLINDINKSLNGSIQGLRFVGIINSTKQQVELNKQILTDYVNARFTDPTESLRIGDIVSTKDMFTYVYLRTDDGSEQWVRYNPEGDIGDILARLQTVESSVSGYDNRISSVENFKSAQEQKNLELDGKITDIESDVSNLSGSIGNLSNCGYVNSTAEEMFKEIKTGLEGLNTKTNTAITDLVNSLSTFTRDITDQVQAAESASIQSSAQSQANVESIRDIKAKVEELKAKDTSIENLIGLLSNLQTGNRADLVSAINEIFTMVNSITGGTSGGGIESTVVKLSTAIGTTDLLGGETIVGALEKIQTALELKATVEEFNNLLNKVGTGSINGELTQNVVEALNDLLTKVRAVDNKFDNYMTKTGCEVTGALLYSGVEDFTGKQIPHVDWIKANLQDKLGEMSTTGLTEYTTVSGSLKELKQSLDRVDSELTNINNKIGDLSTTGIIDQSSVSAGLKELKDGQEAIIADNTTTKEKVRSLEETKADKSAISAMQQDIDLLKGANIVIDILTETKDEVEAQSDIQQWLTDKVLASGKDSAKDGYEIKTSDGYSYTYNNGQWKLMQLPSVALASEDNAGIIKLKNENGYIISSGDGDGSVKLQGYSELVQSISDVNDKTDTKLDKNVYDAKILSLETSIGNNTTLAQEAKNIADANTLAVSGAEAKATEALSTATSAESTSQAAKLLVDEIGTRVEEANNAAQESLQKANIADSKADNAVSVAEEASSNATTALEKAVEAETAATEAKAQSQEVSEKVGDISSLDGAPATVVAAIEKVKDIVGSLSNITGIDNANVVSSIMALKGQIETLNSELDNYYSSNGGQLSGVASYDGSVSAFSGSEIPHATWVETKITDKIGSLSGTGITNNTDVTSMFKELKGNITNLNSKIGNLSGLDYSANDTIANILEEIKGIEDGLRVDVDNAKNLIGDLNTTTLTNKDTVASCLKDLEALISGLRTKNTAIEQDVEALKTSKADNSRLQAVESDLEKVRNARVVVAQISEDKDTVESQADKNAYLDSKVRAAGRTNSEDGYEIVTSDKYVYFRFNGIWNLTDKVELLNATTTRAGGIKLKNEEGYIAPSTLGDGTAILKGYSELKSTVNGIQGNLDLKASLSQVEEKELALKTLINNVSDNANRLDSKVTTIESNVTNNQAAINSLQSDLASTKTELNGKIEENKNLVGDLSTTNIPSGENVSVSTSLAHLKNVTNTLTTEQTDINRSISALTTSKADASAVEEIRSELDLVKGAQVVIDILTEDKATIEAKADERDTWLSEQVRNTGKRSVKSGYVLRTSDGYTYYYFNNRWYLINKQEITNATTSNPGIVKFKDVAGYLTSSPDGDGTAIIKGYSELQSQVASNTQSLLDKVTEDQVDGKISVVNDKLTNFENILTDNTERANLAVQEISTLSDTVRTHGAAIEQLRDSKIGNIQTTGFTGSTIGEQLRAVKTDMDTKASEEMVNTKIGNLSTTGLSNTTDVSNALISLKNMIQTSSGGSSSGDVTEARLEEFERQIKQDMFNNGVDVFKYKDIVSGATFSSDNYIYRIPGMVVDKRGGLHFVNDMRKTGDDYRDPNEIVYAYSNDGLQTFYKCVVIPRVLNSEDSDAVDSQSRTMDPTILYDKQFDKIYILAGCWIKNNTQWVSDNTVANRGGFKYGIMAIGTYNPDTKRYDFTRHTIGGAGCDIVINNYPSNCRGFIGGCAAGIRHSSGKLLMPLQWTTGPGGCKAALLVGTVDTSGNATWEFKYGDSDLDGKSENNVIEDQDGNVIMVVRLDGSQSTPSFITRNFGDDWDVYEPYNNKITTQQYASQGSTISFTTLAGKYVVLSSKPQITNDIRNDAQYYRDQLTVYYMSKGAQKAIPLDVINYPGGDVAPGKPAFGGYSSLAYDAGPDGEKLYIYYEYKLGTQVQDITYLISMVNQLVDKYDNTDLALTPEEIEAVKQEVITSATPEIIGTVANDLNNTIRTSVNDWPEDFVSFIETNKIPSDNAFKLINGDLETAGTLTINGAFLTDGAINPDRVSLSEVSPGMIKVNYPDNNTNGSIRGEIVPISSVDMLSLAFNLYIPRQDASASCCPAVRFFNHATQNGPSYIKGGFEVGTDGVCYITKTNADYFYTLPLDKLLNVVVEYKSDATRLYVDGELVATKTNTSSYNALNNIKAATHMCIGGQGEGKTYTLHLGNISMYNRELTSTEKRSIKFINGLKTGKNLQTLSTEIDSKLSSLSNIDNISNILSIVTDYVDSAVGMTIPQVDKLVLNINPEVLKTNKPVNGLPLLNGTNGMKIMSANKRLNFYLDSTLISNDNRFMDSISTEGSDDKGINTTEGFIFIGTNVDTMWLDISSLGVNFNEDWTFQIGYKLKSAIPSPWTSIFSLTAKVNKANPQSIDFKSNSLRFEASSTAQGGNVNMYGDGIPGDPIPTLWNVPAQNVMDYITITFEAATKLFKCYQGVVDTAQHTYDANSRNIVTGRMNQLLLNRGTREGSNNRKYASTEFHIIRMWKGVVLTGTEVQASLS